MPRRITGVAGAGVFLLALTGCGGSGIYPVHGQLTFPDGSPAAGLEGARIMFEGTGTDGKNYSSIGTIDAEGRFELQTNKPGDGAPLGRNRVLIERKMIDPEHAAPRVIDAKYESLETSGLEFEVKATKNTVKFTVEPVKKP